MVNKEYLIEVWNSVWEEGLTELEVQKRYFTKLDKKLKGEDRFHLMAIKTKIDELENGLQNFRIDGPQVGQHFRSPAATHAQMQI